MYLNLGVVVTGEIREGRREKSEKLGVLKERVSGCVMAHVGFGV